MITYSSFSWRCFCISFLVGHPLLLLFQFAFHFLHYLLYSLCIIFFFNFCCQNAISNLRLLWPFFRMCTKLSTYLCDANQRRTISRLCWKQFVSSWTLSALCQSGYMISSLAMAILGLPTTPGLLYAHVTVGFSFTFSLCAARECWRIVVTVCLQGHIKRPIRNQLVIGHVHWEDSSLLPLLCIRCWGDKLQSAQRVGTDRELDS